MSKCADSCGTPVSYEGGLCNVCRSIRDLKKEDPRGSMVIVALVMAVILGAGAAAVVGFMLIPGPY